MPDPVHQLKSSGHRINRKMFNNILIIRLSAIGDVVMASPLIEALRRSMPGSRLTWLVEDPSKTLLESNPDLDEVIVWPRSRWRKLFHARRYWSLLKDVSSFVKGLRKRGFDLAIDAQGLLKSGLWAYLSGAPERIGIGSKEGSRFLMTRVVDRTGGYDRVSSQYLLLAEALGLDLDNFAMKMYVAPEAMESAKNIGPPEDIDFAVFAPFTTRPQKHWIKERWVELSGRIFDELRMEVVLLGGKEDIPEASLIAEGNPHILDLTGKTSLQEAAAMIQRSCLLFGVDTGLTHMGIALDVPTIALFGATRPYLDTTGTSGIVLYHSLECSPCRRSPSCDDDFTCMKAITVDEVMDTTRKTLSQRGPVP